MSRFSDSHRRLILFRSPLSRSARCGRHDAGPAGFCQVTRREVGGPELEEPEVLAAAASLDTGGSGGTRGDLGTARMEAAT
jgi:hypothetical protein